VLNFETFELYIYLNVENRLTVLFCFEHLTVLFSVVKNAD